MFLFISMRCRKLKNFEIKGTWANSETGFFMIFGTKWVNPIQPSVAFHIETGHLFCSAKHMVGFYVKCSTGLKWVKDERPFHEVEKQ